MKKQNQIFNLLGLLLIIYVVSTNKEKFVEPAKKIVPEDFKEQVATSMEQLSTLDKLTNEDAGPTDPQSVARLLMQKQAIMMAIGKQNEVVLSVDVKQGEGVPALCGHIVKMHYITYLQDGREYQNTEKKKQPLHFKIGEGKVKPLFENAVMNMKVGGIRQMTLMPEMMLDADQIKKDDIVVSSPMGLRITLAEIVGNQDKKQSCDAIKAAFNNRKISGK